MSALNNEALSAKLPDDVMSECQSNCHNNNRDYFALQRVSVSYHICSLFVPWFRQCLYKLFIGQRFWVWLLWYMLILLSMEIYWDEASKLSYLDLNTLIPMAAKLPLRGMQSKLNGNMYVHVYRWKWWNSTQFQIHVYHCSLMRFKNIKISFLAQWFLEITPEINWHKNYFSLRIMHKSN